jgi:hypothetical protein
MLILPTTCTAALCCAALQAAALIHAAMSSGSGPLAGAELAAVTEGLKVLLLLSNRTAAQGQAAQVRHAVGETVR